MVVGLRVCIVKALLDGLEARQRVGEKAKVLQIAEPFQCHVYGDQFRSHDGVGLRQARGVDM